MNESILVIALLLADIASPCDLKYFCDYLLVRGEPVGWDRKRPVSSGPKWTRQGLVSSKSILLHFQIMW